LKVERGREEKDNAETQRALRNAERWRSGWLRESTVEREEEEKDRSVRKTSVSRCAALKFREKAA
jgi:hypothetical protein